MAMASVSPLSSAVGHVVTKRQLKKGLWIGRNRGSVAGLDCTGSGRAYAGVAKPVGFVLVGPRDAKKSCLCGGISRGFLVVQDRGCRRLENVVGRLRCVGSDEGSGNDEDEAKRREDDEEVDQALNLDGKIPTTSDGFLKQVSSNAYDLRRQLEQNIENSSYDVLEANPWRETSKPVYVLAQDENRLLTMRTRRASSEVERELGMLFPKRGSRRGRQGRPSSQARDDESNASSGSDDRFRMLVEDVREGVLVFEDEEEATRYCSLLDGHGKGCTGVAELDASDVFAVCQKTQRLAVLFRKGTTPPQPDRLQLNLKARKRSLED